MRRLAATVALLTACSPDTFTTSEGGVDAGGDAFISDANAGEGSASDASDCPYLDATSGCSGACIGACCVTSSSATCETGACGGAALACTKPSDCASIVGDGAAMGPLCCLDNMGQPIAECAVEVGSKSTSACSALGTCDGDAGRFRLCQSDSDCGTFHCKQGVIEGTSFMVGICL
jgi:hypothetical protein